MPALYRELPAGAQAAYSEAYEAARHADLHRSVASLNGSFQSKTIKGKRYWYFAYRDALDRKVRQIYVGPDSAQLELLKARAAEPPGTGIPRMAAAALAHGCASITPKHFRIIRQIGDAGFFRAGGLLVGSHAFVALGNLLGVHWIQPTHTLDIDFAHAGRGNIAVALPADVDVDPRTAIESLEMGFLPSLGLGGAPSGTYVSPVEPDLRLDFLTPLRRNDAVVEAPNLKVSLQPLRFLDFLLEQPAHAALLSGQGAVVVNVPDPARFAVHKMIVAGERPVSERPKANKDLAQAAALVECMLDQGYADRLQEATDEVQARGPGWRSRFGKAMERLAARQPMIAERWPASS
ncbi:GSU2403 family nucleotidyltransferase fold protein [Pseudoxanthomonas koreensis]|uniref:GSU2403 family nucleotidyltransferase fold protein n=1 Tax=Pseudoxanthomonas koreensis TaxID=266061 RepID=UPI0013913923|nr:nucleotidyltransferase domain-containing protein [Pseudoxanthomonas koreensis]